MRLMIWIETKPKSECIGILAIELLKIAHYTFWLAKTQRRKEL